MDDPNSLKPTSGLLTLPLDSVDATIELVGGKGASLARMSAAGLPVPTGFHVTTAAYRRFVESNDLETAIMESATVASSKDPVSLERAEFTIRELFGHGVMPEAVASAICQAYANLGGRSAVAVRSSATTEDLPNLSFAGQHESYLNVRGKEALLDAVRRCWASLWTARAIGYRERMRVDHRGVAMGVVVQVMAPAEISGVLFTANPFTGDRSELLINASFGLGEAVVSGKVTPDAYVLDRASLATKTVTPGTKEVMVIPSAHGTATVEVPEERRTEQALPAGLLKELGALALRVEQLFGGVPQDIEWTVAAGRCWLLQSRPIANLPPPPLQNVRWEPPEPGSAWVRRQVVEHMPEPLSPLFEELYVREGLERSVEMEVLRETVGVYSRLIDKMVPRPYFTTVNGYAYLRGNVNFRWWMMLFVIPLIARGFRMLFRMGVPYWKEKGLPRYLATIERWKQVNRSTVSDEQLLAGVRELAWADALYWWPSALAIGAAKVTDWILNRFLTRWAQGSGLTSGHFLRGYPSRTLDAETELENIARRIHECDELRRLTNAAPPQRLLELLAGQPDGKALAADIQGYFDRYGHLIYNLDFVAPTQVENPLPVLLSLKALAEQPDRNTQELQAELAHQRDQQVEATFRSLGPIRRRAFRWLVGKAQHYAPFREEAIFYMGAAWPTLRRLALELGQRLAISGMLDKPEHVFFLTSDELVAASVARAKKQARKDLAELARDRHNLREARKRLNAPPAVPPSYRLKFGRFDLSSRESQVRNPEQATTLRGFAVSPGRVTAPASVILSPAEFGEMIPGTILVCPTTTPAWTPLFAQARGLVTDIGGILAHGSIIAREYGIPAVMGTGIATRRIVSGQPLSVDGNEGIVTLVGSSTGRGL